MLIFHLPETYDMSCWILGSILVAVLGAGVLGQDNGNCKEWLNYNYYHYVRQQKESCGLERYESFLDGDNLLGNKIISAVTSACSNYTVVRQCLSNITAQCSQHSPAITVADRDHSRLCDGSQPSDWYLSGLHQDVKVGHHTLGMLGIQVAYIVMTDDFEIDRNCSNLLIDEALRNCPFNWAKSPFRVSTYRPVTVWLSRAESYISLMFSCLMTDLEKTIAKYEMCDVQAADIMVYLYSYLAVDRQINPGLSPSDDVFESFQAFVAPPSKRDSWTYDWLF